jgi:hypothetical protein
MSSIIQLEYNRLLDGMAGVTNFSSVVDNVSEARVRSELVSSQSIDSSTGKNALSVLNVVDKAPEACV